jgi:hypothetical protein
MKPLFNKEDFAEATAMAESNYTADRANALHEERCEIEYWKKQCRRCADDNVVISKQRSNLKTENILLRKALSSYLDGDLWALIIAEARAGGTSGTIADIGSYKARIALEGK